MPKTDAQAMGEFVADPKNFLRSNFVCIAGGGGTRNAGLTVFTMVHFGTRHGFGSILHRHKKRTAWQIAVSQNQNQNNLGANEFVAYYCPMRAMGTALVNTSAALPANPAVRLMITSQLSGCTFAYEALGGGAANVMHVRPELPAQQPNRVTARTNAANVITGVLNHAHLAEKGGVYQEKATLVGWYHHGRWRFYAQLQDMHNTKETAMGLAKL